jgi:hypothetical protein
MDDVTPTRVGFWGFFCVTITPTFAGERGRGETRKLLEGKGKKGLIVI